MFVRASQKLPLLVTPHIRVDSGKKFDTYKLNDGKALTYVLESNQNLYFSLGIWTKKTLDLIPNFKC